jgi:hypothetical protein
MKTDIWRWWVRLTKVVRKLLEERGTTRELLFPKVCNECRELCLRYRRETDLEDEEHPGLRVVCARCEERAIWTERYDQLSRVHSQIAVVMVDLRKTLMSYGAQGVEWRGEPAEWERKAHEAEHGGRWAAKASNGQCYDVIHDGSRWAIADWEEWSPFWEPHEGEDSLEGIQFRPLTADLFAAPWPVYEEWEKRKAEEGG